MRSILFMIPIILLISCTQVEEQIDQNGVFRDIPNSVEKGQTFKVTLNINVDEEQKYFLVEEEVPKEFEIVGAVHDKNNHIKLIEIENARSKVYRYEVIAKEKGNYDFSGRYQFDGMESDVQIKGSTQIYVK